MLCVDCFQELGTDSTCPHCGFSDSNETDPRRLPLRSALKGGRYEMGRLLGHGGFGLTYKAFDKGQYKALVVIKECLIANERASIRALDGRTVLVTKVTSGSYRALLQQFYEEAATIAKMSHPNIVRIVDFFYENNTAYYVMPLVDGVDLRKYLIDRGASVSEQTLVPIAEKLIGALSALHAKGKLHRDIKPQNILLTRDGLEPVLIDFGASRDYSRQEKSSWGAHTDGYAPIEQVKNLTTQGPWTDVYSLSATLYRSLSGRIPTPSDHRIAENGRDQYIPIEQVAPEVSSRFANAINKGLSQDIRERPQSMLDFQKLLPGRRSDPDGVTKRVADFADDASNNGSDAGRELGWIGKIFNNHPKAPLWFLPSALALVATFASTNTVQYVAFGFLPIVILNFVAWGLVFRNHIGRGGNSTASLPVLGIGQSTGQNITSGYGVVLFLDGTMAGKSFMLQDSQFLVIGRSAPSDVIIRNKKLSKHHVKITYIQRQFEIVDLDSTNGTFRVLDANDGRQKVKKIDRFIGLGTFLIGPDSPDRVRFECKVEGIA